jgi:hypothetical protein
MGPHVQHGMTVLRVQEDIAYVFPPSLLINDSLSIREHSEEHVETSLPLVFVQSLRHLKAVLERRATILLKGSGGCIIAVPDLFCLSRWNRIRSYP